MAHHTTYQLKQILKYNRDGSQYTRETRHQNLMRFIRHMQENRGYATHWNINNLSKKEMYRYVHDLKGRGLADRTIENNLKDIRWLASKVGREDQMPTNRECGLKKRVFGNVNKSFRLNAGLLRQLDYRMQLINRLKFEFGLREKEALKIRFKEATEEEGVIQLKATWCKNGRPRTIEVVNESQRELLREIGAFMKEQGDYSMIPHKLQYSSYRNTVQEKSTVLGIHGHGLRHAWAHDRFKQLSGMDCPIAGGPAYKELTLEKKESWDAAAEVVISELGHGKDRLDTLANYIGSR